MLGLFCREVVPEIDTTLPCWNRIHAGEKKSCCSAAQSCPALCDPMNCSMPGLPVHHQLLELAQAHVLQGGNAIQSSHPLSSPSPAFNLSQHQGLFQWVGSLHQVAKVLGFSFSISPSNEYSGNVNSVKKENVKGKLHNDKGFRGKKSQAVSHEKWIKF